MNQVLKPSRPGALSGSILAIAFLISFLEIGAVRAELSSMETLLGIKFRTSQVEVPRGGGSSI